MCNLRSAYDACYDAKTKKCIIILPEDITLIVIQDAWMPTFRQRLGTVIVYTDKFFNFKTGAVAHCCSTRMIIDPATGNWIEQKISFVSLEYD